MKNMTSDEITGIKNKLKVEFSYWYAPTSQGVDVPIEYLFSYKKKTSSSKNVISSNPFMRK